LHVVVVVVVDDDDDDGDDDDDDDDDDLYQSGRNKCFFFQVLFLYGYTETLPSRKL
jgi:hypothetical protein